MAHIASIVGHKKKRRKKKKTLFTCLGHVCDGGPGGQLEHLDEVAVRRLRIGLQMRKEKQGKAHEQVPHLAGRRTGWTGEIGRQQPSLLNLGGLTHTKKKTG